MEKFKGYYVRAKMISSKLISAQAHTFLEDAFL